MACHDMYHGKATQLNNQQNISSKNFPFQSILISLAPLVNFRKTAAVHLLLPFCFVEQKTHTKRQQPCICLFSCKKIIERSSIKAMLKWKISILSFSTETVCRRFSFHISSESKSLKIPPKDTWRKNVLWPLISWTSFAVKCALRNHNSEVEIRNKKDPGKSSSIFGWRTTCS